MRYFALNMLLCSGKGYKMDNRDILNLIPKGSPLRKELGILYMTNRKAYLNLKAALAVENRHYSHAFLELYALTVQNNSLLEFLYQSFVWKDTPQGHQYWVEILAQHNNIMGN